MNNDFMRGQLDYIMGAEQDQNGSDEYKRGYQSTREKELERKKEYFNEWAEGL